MGVTNPTGGRIASLDQFRGYTVLGMFFVNFLGHFQAVPAIFKHHNTYCSYADTIMPHFFFAVGFAYRLTFLRRQQAAGSRAAYGRAVKRSLGLILLGIVVYHLDGRVNSWAELRGLTAGQFVYRAFTRDPFETLVHIGVTSLWVLPVIAAGAWARIVFAAASAGLHFALSRWFYYDWVLTRPGIDGGPLGFLTWTIPLIAGSLAYDLMGRLSAMKSIAPLLAWGVGLMALGYGLACLNRVTMPNEVPSTAAVAWQDYLVEPPFVPPTRPVNIWTMSQRAGSVSYLTFGAGLSFAVYALFVLLCDVGRFGWRVFITLGANALAGYLIHDLVAEAVKPYAPGDAPLWFALAAFGLFFAICYVFLRYLEKHQMYLRI